MSRTPWVLCLDDELRVLIVAALALGRRELRRNGTRVPAEFDVLLATLADQEGPERPRLGTAGEAVEPVAVSYAEAGRRLGGVSVRTVRRLVAAGQLESVRAGRRVLVPVAGLHAYVAVGRSVG